MPDQQNNYLIICQTPKQAVQLFKDAVSYCLDQSISIVRASQCTLSIFTRDRSVRFVSEERAERAIIGFHGKVRMAWEFENKNVF